LGLAAQAAADDGHAGVVADAVAERALDVRGGVPVAEAEQRAANTLLRGLLMQLDHDTAGDDEPHWRRWSDVTNYIQANLPDAPGVTELARHFGYTRSHFSRLFRQRVGLAPQAYIINARIALAKELLRETTMNVTRVAAHAGYHDVFRFSRQFKQQTGRSPSAYRHRALRRS
jgi:AraC-like DNA-binding protein